MKKRLMLDMMSNVFLVIIASRRRFDCGYASAQREAGLYNG